MVQFQLILFSLFSISFTSLAFAEPLDNVNFDVLEYENNQATINLSWNSHPSATNYEIGCVSCMPNIVHFESSENVILTNITPFPNNSNAMLYVIAYDSQNEIITAKQLLINLDS